MTLYRTPAVIGKFTVAETQPGLPRVPGVPDSLKGADLSGVPEVLQMRAVWPPTGSPADLQNLTFVIMPFTDEESSTPCSQVKPCPLAVVTGTAVGKSDELHAINFGLPDKPTPPLPEKVAVIA